MSCVPFIGDVEFVLFGGQYLGPPILYRIVVSCELLLFPLQAPCCSHEPSLEANLFHWIFRHAEFVVAEAYLVLGGDV